MKEDKQPTNILELNQLMNKDRDHRPAKGRWAPGYYWNDCQSCPTRFCGDKRATQCADCVYGTK